MKFLKKINLGLILTIIVVTAVTIYSVNIELKRNKQKDEIKNLCEEFIDLTNKYAILPEEYQNLENKMSEEELDTYISEIKNNLKEKMIDNSSAIDIQTKILETELRNQIDSENIVTDFERKIIKINSYSFDGNQVTVNFKSKVDKNIKYYNIGFDINGNEIKEEANKNDSFDTNTETIILQETDNMWKVVYSDLEYSRNSFYSYADIAY